MMKRIRVRRLRVASIFKICVLGSVVSFFLICALLSIPAFFGAHVLYWNDVAVTGPAVVIMGPLIGLIIGAVFGLLFGVFVYLGLRLYSMFRDLEIEYVPTPDR